MEGGADVRMDDVKEALGSRRMKVEAARHCTIDRKE